MDFILHVNFMVEYIQLLCESHISAVFLSALQHKEY